MDETTSPQFWFTEAPTDPQSVRSHSRYLIELAFSCVNPYLVAALPLKLLYNSALLEVQLVWLHVADKWPSHWLR